jgi:hypothetical protein
MSLNILAIFVKDRLFSSRLRWPRPDVRLFLGRGLLAFKVGLAPLAFDNFVVLFAHDV